MTTRSRLCLPLLALFVCAAGADWPQFRGPFFNGSTDETNLPTEFSPSKNVKWSTEIPGFSASSPIVSGNHVFLTTADSSSDELLALCLDRESGKLNWQHSIAKGIRQDTRSNFASPSPATDGKTVFFFFGNGDLCAFDFAGKKLWSRNIQKDFGPFAFQWTFSSSPLLYDGKLYMQVLQRDVAVGNKGFRGKVNESYLLALEPLTGKVLWQRVRPSQAKAESREAFSTPIPYEHDGRRELLVVGGDDLTGHDPETGEELWRWGTWNPQRIGHWRLVPSPVAGGGVILACAPKNDPIYAVTAGGKGVLSDDQLAWSSESTRELTSDVPTPAFYDGDFFILSDLKKSLARVEPQTGKVKWMLKTPGRGKYEASPTAADGKIYLINFDGDVVIVDAKDGQVINNISMDRPTGEEMVRSTIVASHGNLFIRTTNKLYCIGK